MTDHPVDSHRFASRNSKSRMLYRINMMKIKRCSHIGIELSSDSNSPGVLRIFGGSLRAGAHYKSVLASSNSTALGLVKEALWRYNISDSSTEDFVLCEVLRKLDSNGSAAVLDTSDKASEYHNDWTIEYVRLVAGNDRPLLLQMLWKPIDGYSRSFEIRKRNEIPSMIIQGEVTTCTINSNARRFQMSKVKAGVIPGGTSQSCRTSGPKDKLGSIARCASHQERLNSPRFDPTGYNNYYPEKHSELPSSPMNCPFLLTLRGFDLRRDKLYYYVEKENTVIGSLSANGTTPTVLLNSPDVLTSHCTLSRRKINSSSDDNCLQIVEIEPDPSAKVSVNGWSVSSRIVLASGDIVSIGDHYLFLYKDLTSGHDIPLKLPWLHDTSLNTIPEGRVCDPQMLDRSSDICTPEEEKLFDFGDQCLEDGSEDIYRRLSIKKDRSTISLLHTDGSDDGVKTKFSYGRGSEEDLIKAIIRLVNPIKDVYKLAPAYMFCLSIDYSLLAFGLTHTRKLIARILGEFRALLLACTTGVSPCETTPQTVEERHEEEVARLRTVIYWTSNVVELYLFTKENTIRDESSSEDGRASVQKHDTATLIQQYEEIIKFGFQQAVYTSTKILYPYVLDILDANPFSETEDANRLTDVLSILDETLVIVEDLELHEEVQTQIFTYLFFFLNTSAFNKLLTKGAGASYYTWYSGVQIAGNLEKLEEWAERCGFHPEFIQTFLHLATAVGILATPKAKLIQSSWQSLREQHTNVNPSQLHQLLSEYQLGSGREYPAIWMPEEADMKDVLATGSISLKLSNHPSFAMPTGACIIDINQEITDSTFIEYYNNINNSFGLAEIDDDDSGYSVSNHTPTTEQPPSLKQPVTRLYRGTDNHRKLESPGDLNPSFETINLSVTESQDTMPPESDTMDMPSVVGESGQHSEDNTEHDVPASCEREVPDGIESPKEITSCSQDDILDKTPNLSEESNGESQYGLYPPIVFVDRPHENNFILKHAITDNGIEIEIPIPCGNSHLNMDDFPESDELLPKLEYDNGWNESDDSNDLLYLPTIRHEESQPIHTSVIETMVHSSSANIVNSQVSESEICENAKDSDAAAVNERDIATLKLASPSASPAPSSDPHSHAQMSANESPSAGQTTEPTAGQNSERRRSCSPGEILVEGNECSDPSIKSVHIPNEHSDGQHVFTRKSPIFNRSPGRAAFKGRSAKSPVRAVSSPVSAKSLREAIVSPEFVMNHEARPNRSKSPGRPAVSPPPVSPTSFESEVLPPETEILAPEPTNTGQLATRSKSPGRAAVSPKTIGRGPPALPACPRRMANGPISHEQRVIRSKSPGGRSAVSPKCEARELPPALPDLPPSPGRMGPEQISDSHKSPNQSSPVLPIKPTRTPPPQPKLPPSREPSLPVSAKSPGRPAVGPPISPKSPGKEAPPLPSMPPSPGRVALGVSGLPGAKISIGATGRVTSPSGRSVTPGNLTMLFNGMGMNHFSPVDDTIDSESDDGSNMNVVTNNHNTIKNTKNQTHGEVGEVKNDSVLEADNDSVVAEHGDSDTSDGKLSIDENHNKKPQNRYVSIEQLKQKLFPDHNSRDMVQPEIFSIDVPSSRDSVMSENQRGLRVLSLEEDSTNMDDKHTEDYGRIKITDEILPKGRPRQSPLHGGGDIITVILRRTENGLGLGLIDGLHTPLKIRGLFVRSITEHSPADLDGRIAVGDKVLSVNGKNLVEANYASCMGMIRRAGSTVKLVIMKSDKLTTNQIAKTSIDNDAITISCH